MPAKWLTVLAMLKPPVQAARMVETPEQLATAGRLLLAELWLVALVVPQTQLPDLRQLLLVFLLVVAVLVREMFLVQAAPELRVSSTSSKTSNTPS